MVHPDTTGIKLNKSKCRTIYIIYINLFSNSAAQKYSVYEVNRTKQSLYQSIITEIQQYFFS